jgi:GT2 family glycosyltransferase
VLIVVVSWNTRALLDRCLASMARDVREGRAQVCVVDNGSSDGSQELVRERHPWARLVEPAANLGYGPAVNLGAAGFRTAWVAASNADVELEPGALAALLDAGARHPRAGVLGPRLLLDDGSVQASVQPFPGPAETIVRNLGLHVASRRAAERFAMPGFWDPGAAAEVDWVTGAFLLVRRAAWEALGGFDEAQWMYAEDIDLCWRARRAGWATWYEPAATVRHRLSVAAAQAFGDADARADRIVAADYAWLRSRRGDGYAALTGLLQVGTLAIRVLVERVRFGAHPPPGGRDWHTTARHLRRQVRAIGHLARASQTVAALRPSRARRTAGRSASGSRSRRAASGQ